LGGFESFEGPGRFGSWFFSPLRYQTPGSTWCFFLSPVVGINLVQNVSRIVARRSPHGRVMNDDLSKANEIFLFFSSQGKNVLPVGIDRAKYFFTK
jgi:hypothetical protein